VFRSAFQNRGLTLLELMIALAIAGILTTVGMPTYEGMVTKAKHAEARQVLGAIYQTEVAFNSEWGTYGSSLFRLGLEVRSGLNYYVAGFIQLSACDNTGTLGDAPNDGSAMGLRIKLVWPEYYDFPPAGSGPGGQVFKSRILPVDSSGTPMDYGDCGDFTTPGQSGFSVNVGGPYFLTSPANIGGFRAKAAGVVHKPMASGIPLTGVQNLDVWTIDESRVLNHAQTGKE